MFETLLTDVSDKVLVITLNRPERLNALSQTLMDELKSVLDQAAEDSDISVIIVKANGRAFSVGYDLNESDWITSQYPANFPDGVDQDEDTVSIRKLLAYWLDMWRYPKPIIAQVHGACLSGAGELLAACDLVVAADDAFFGHPAARDLGIPPTVFFWPLLIGMRQAKEMLYTAKSISAEKALNLGLVNHVVSRSELDEFTRELAYDIARTPVEHLKILKESANNFYDNMGLDKSTDQAAILDAEFHQSPVFLNFFKLVNEKGMKAALAERQKLFGP